MTTLLALLLTLLTPLQIRPVALNQKITMPAVRLDFREFLEPATTELKPSEKLRSLQGKRVRLTGFMAQMEELPENYFYLCSHPVYCDESGGGIGDLPVDAVRVVRLAKKGQPIKFTAQPIEVSGILELGGQSETEQDSWAVRILAESFTEVVNPPKPASQKQRKKSKQ